MPIDDDQCLSTLFQLGVQSISFFFHQIFESQLIIRDTVFFLFFFLKHADTSDGLGMAALVLVGVRDAAINEESEARRPWTLVPSDADGRGHAAMCLAFGPWSPPHRWPRPPRHRRGQGFLAAAAADAHVGFPAPASPDG
jgi:hypothetical protein